MMPWNLCNAHGSRHDVLNGMQAILWQVVDETLSRLRAQFSAELEAFWNARAIYQAQLLAWQVLMHNFSMCPN